MLGMMNSPADTVEFYAAKKKGSEDDDDESDLKVFREFKQKKSLTYTPDGRRMIDGKVESSASATAMHFWEQTLRRGAITTHMIGRSDVNTPQQAEGCEDQAIKDSSVSPKPSNPVEVYAPNRSCAKDLSDEDLKTFTEIKRNKAVTYTKDLHVEK
ncbi:hypothetical protein GCK32_006072 [Trichostrongylus colubriformis]|uniref:Uncharacterized protein n=1 Tax=Trichostrongylus colubriformis TaxID=6319 RepID=A0AAN8J1I4_TRICO